MTDNSDIDKVLDAAVKEMGWRLEDDERRAKIPDHVLIKFVGEANKAAERRRQDDKPEDETPSVLEMVEKLPPRKAVELLRREIKRKRDELAELEEAYASKEQGREPIPELEVRPRMSEEAPLRQPDQGASEAR